MIQRFEDEYPETRLSAPDANSIHSTSQLSTSPPPSTIQTLSTSITESEHPSNSHADSDDDEGPKVLRSRHNSDVSLASRALSLEEGRIHRLGHRVRTEILNASSPPSPTLKNVDRTPDDSLNKDADHEQQLLSLRSKLESYSGDELRTLSNTLDSEEAFQRLSENATELSKLLQENPAEFEKFKISQIAALKNKNPDVSSEQGGKADEGKKDGDDYAIVD